MIKFLPIHVDGWSGNEEFLALKVVTLSTKLPSCGLFGAAFLQICV